MLLHAENFAGDEVVSCLYHHIGALSNEIKNFHLFCDICFSQKKRKIIGFFDALVDSSQVDKVTIYYPILATAECLAT